MVRSGTGGRRAAVGEDLFCGTIRKAAAAVALYLKENEKDRRLYPDGDPFFVRLLFALLVAVCFSVFAARVYLHLLAPYTQFNLPYGALSPLV